MCQSQAFGHRGIIKDGGVLCSCDWANVISASKFDTHACKQYRRASRHHNIFALRMASLAATRISTSAPAWLTSPEKQNENNKKAIKIHFKISSIYITTWKHQVITEKMTKKDHGLHKFFFEKGVLPDRTELGYYASGEVIIILCVIISLGFSFMAYITVGRNCWEGTKWVMEYIVTATSLRCI